MLQFKLRKIKTQISDYNTFDSKLDKKEVEEKRKKMLNYCNPVGIKIHSFRKPTEEEMSQDFLWRVHKVIPGSI